MEVDIANEALLSLHSDLAASNFQPQIHTVDNQAPICVDPSRTVWLDFEAADVAAHVWDWKITSNDAKGSTSTLHVTGKIKFRSVEDPQFLAEFARYERFVSHERCSQVLNSPDADDIIQGRNIYKTFAEIVDYGEMYRGLQKLVGKGNESAGRISKRYTGESWLDTHLSDCFSQVGGIWVNCMTDRASTDIYIANGFEQWIRSPKIGNKDPRPSIWDVFAYHHHESDKSYITDIFIFDPTSSALMEVILGINYAKVPKLSMSKILMRLTAADSQKGEPAAAPSAPAQMSEPLPTSKAPETVKIAKPKKEKKAGSGPNVTGSVVAILADLSGLEPEVIKVESQLADLGIDSLMGMEMAHELEGKFNCSLPEDQLADITTCQMVVQLVNSVLGITDDNATGHSDDDDDQPSSGSQSTDILSDSDTSISSAEGAKKEAAPAKQATPSNGDLELTASTILEAFGETKALTDQFFADYRCADYLDIVNPKQTQLCVALTLDAFEQLGCNIRTARTGQKLERIGYLPQHGRLADYLYNMLEKEARLIDVNGHQITRTAISPPAKSSKDILESLMRNYPDHDFANRLTYYAGTRLADVLTGKSDGVKLIFGSKEGQELVTGLYGDSLLNKLAYKQMEDFLRRLVSKLPAQAGPLKILEMGAGTGGTTKYLVPLLASLNVPVEYTFTDLGPSFVAAARKKFKPYPFMKFRAHDIEKPPADDLIGIQHLVIASNAVHATHSLTESTKNIHKFLRPDGFLMMLEMTETLYWIDMIFGLLEGWWLFDDGRRHAISHQSHWEREMQSVGYGHVDWTDGHRPENKTQKIIIALASKSRYDRLPIPPKPKESQDPCADSGARQVTVDGYIRKHTQDFIAPIRLDQVNVPDASSRCVMITGATGSLGAHLVANFANLADVESVICLNRQSKGSEPEARQRESIHSKGIDLSSSAESKLQVFETDTTKPMLGLPRAAHEKLLGIVTHIVHNAWPMSGKRPVRGFESQFQVMRNLIDFARDLSCRRRKGSKVSLQFISSIATVGHYPLITGDSNVPEERMAIDSVLPNGYGDAKFVCERMLDETLHRYPEDFRTMAVRLGQVAGSKTSGYWNSLEHLSFLVKSSQTLKTLPDFDGLLSWTPVNDVAATLGDLLLADNVPYPIYHIDNPVRQPWREMIPVLAASLDIPQSSAIPFEEWVSRVRSFPGSELDNPAVKLIDFLDGNFIRMSCGGLLLDTKRSREHSETLANVGPVSEDVARKYVQAWKEMGFLHE